MSKKKGCRYFFVAGGKTGGHLFPGLAVTDEIIKINPGLIPIFIGIKNSIEEKVVPAKGFKLLFTNVSGFYGKSILQKFKCGINLLIALMQMMYYMLKFRPVFVLGLGGYVSFPACLVATMCFVPLFMLEQNNSLGIVNRILGRFARRLFLPIENKTLARENVKFSGNPIRREIADLAHLPITVNHAIFNILVFGGSQGSQVINKVVVESLAALKKSQLNLHITHQCGYNELEYINQCYLKIGMQQYSISPFIDDMASAYKKSDLIICRSGSVVFELSAAAKLLILIPITNSSGNHQIKNCQFLVDKNAAFGILEKDLSANKLVEKINFAYLNRHATLEMRFNLRRLFKADAALNIAQECLSQLKL